MFCQKGLIPWAAGDYKHVCCASRSKIHKKCFFDLVAKQTVRIPSSPVINQGVRMPNSFYKPREKKRKGVGAKVNEGYSMYYMQAHAGEVGGHRST